MTNYSILTATLTIIFVSFPEQNYGTVLVSPAKFVSTVYMGTLVFVCMFVCVCCEGVTHPSYCMCLKFLQIRKFGLFINFAGIKFRVWLDCKRAWSKEHYCLENYRMILMTSNIATAN